MIISIAFKCGHAYFYVHDDFFLSNRNFSTGIVYLYSYAIVHRAIHFSFM